MSWYTEEEIEKLLEDEELRKRIARFVTMSGEEFFDEVYTHLSAEELEEYLDDGFSYSVPDDAYYLAARDWIRIGIYCFLFGSVSGGDAGCGSVFRVVCSSLLCGRHSF